MKCVVSQNRISQQCKIPKLVSISAAVWKLVRQRLENRSFSSLIYTINLRIKTSTSDERKSVYHSIYTAAEMECFYLETDGNLGTQYRKIKYNQTSTTHLHEQNVRRQSPKMRRTYTKSMLIDPVANGLR